MLNGAVDTPSVGIGFLLVWGLLIVAFVLLGVSLLRSKVYAKWVGYASPDGSQAAEGQRASIDLSPCSTSVALGISPHDGSRR
ncbi:MAG: hypothetical protein R2823_03045 [Acidimicrobiia bacterium]